MEMNWTDIKELLSNSYDKFVKNFHFLLFEATPYKLIFVHKRSVSNLFKCLFQTIQKGLYFQKNIFIDWKKLNSYKRGKKHVALWIWEFVKTSY